MPYKLIATVRGGTTNSALTSKQFETVEEARAGAKQLMHENPRINRITIVADGPTVRFIEWIEKS
jgi:hypothetical protein